MKNKISVFVGIANNVFVLTATSNGKNTYQFEPVISKRKKEYSILLEALIKTVSSFKDISIDFYSNNDSFAFEWEQEYLKNGKFSDTIKHYDAWNLIARIVKNNKIKLHVKGENEVLNAVAKKYKKEAFNYGN